MIKQFEYNAEIVHVGHDNIGIHIMTGPCSSRGLALPVPSDDAKEICKHWNGPIVKVKMRVVVEIEEDA